MGPKPGQKVQQEILGAVVEGGTALATNHPVVGVPAKVVKTIVHVSKGEGTNAIKEGVGLVPGPVGEVGDVIPNLHSLSNDVPQLMQQCQPPGGK